MTHPALPPTHWGRGLFWSIHPHHSSSFLPTSLTATRRRGCWVNIGQFAPAWAGGGRLRHGGPGGASRAGIDWRIDDLEEWSISFHAAGGSPALAAAEPACRSPGPALVLREKRIDAAASACCVMAVRGAAVEFHVSSREGGGSGRGGGGCFLSRFPPTLPPLFVPSSAHVRPVVPSSRAHARLSELSPFRLVSVCPATEVSLPFAARLPPLLPAPRLFCPHRAPGLVALRPATRPVAPCDFSPYLSPLAPCPCPSLPSPIIIIIFRHLVLPP